MKVTNFFFLAALTATLGWHAGAQTEQSPPQYRVVSGQIYDINKSPLWQRMAGDILKVLTNEIVVETFTIRTNQRRDSANYVVYHNIRSSPESENTKMSQ